MPLLGVLASAVLFVLAATRFPGGYDWAHHYISMLLRPIGPDALDNPARPLGVTAMGVLCLSVGAVFLRISRRAERRFHQVTLQIAGPASMVYAFLAVTPLHDLMVTISVAFFLAAMSSALHLMAVERRYRMLVTGSLCLATMVVTAVMYYGDVLTGWMAIAQKLTFLSCVGWLLVLDLRAAHRGKTTNP